MEAFWGESINRTNLALKVVVFKSSLLTKSNEYGFKESGFWEGHRLCYFGELEPLAFTDDISLEESVQL